MRNVECGIEGRAYIPHSEFRIPNSFLSRRSPPLGIEVMLQQHRRRERVHVVLAAPGRPAHCAHGPECARRGEPLVPQVDRLSRAACDVAGERPRCGGGFRLGPVLVERQADHDAGHGVLLEQGEKLAHREAFAGAAGEGGQGLGEGARLIGEGEADAALAPVDAQQPALASAGRHPCAIVAKNSLFVLVRLSRSSRNSIASTGGMSARKLRSRYTLLSSSLERRISSLPCSTRRLAFSITMSATWTWRSAGSSNVEEITSTLGPLTFSSMSVTSSGRSSMSSTMR